MCSIYIDADGCPVVEETLQIADIYGLAVILVCDTSHIYDAMDAQMLVVDKGKDRSDFVILSHLQKGDIVVTQDYGLAALVLSKNAYAIFCNGMLYTQDNIDSLLYMRHQSSIRRKHGHYGKHNKKRTTQDDEDFIQGLSMLCTTLLTNGN